MAMKKRAVPQKKTKTTNDDAVIYQIIIAMGVAAIAIFALQMIGRYYGMVDYLFGIRTGLLWAGVVFGAVALADLVAYVRLRNRKPFWKAAGIPIFIIAMVFVCTCAVLYYTWTEYLPVLYFFYIAAAVLYMIALLYQHEFFLLSLINTCAGGVFYALSRYYSVGVYFSGAALALNVGLAVLILVCGGLMFAAGKHGGQLKLFGREITLFSHGVSPILFYCICAIWLICLVVSAFLGSVFAYYCVFAVVAFELISAVYYTVKLS